MLLIVLLLIPFVTATLLIAARPDKSARAIALVASLLSAVLVIAQWVKFSRGLATDFVDHDWVPDWGLRLKLMLDGPGLLMVLLTAVFSSANAPW